MSDLIFTPFIFFSGSGYQEPLMSLVHHPHVTIWADLDYPVLYQHVFLDVPGPSSAPDQVVLPEGPEPIPEHERPRRVSNFCDI